MSKAILTYGKRELRKVLLSPIFSLIWVVLLFGVLNSGFHALMRDSYLAHGFTEHISIYTVGDLFFFYLCEMALDEVYMISALMFEIFLVQRLFYLENRDGVSDFLRILPIRERDKAWVKIGIGEVMNLFFALSFGVIGTIVYSTTESGILLRSYMLPGGATSTNGVLVIWQIALMMFVTMSAIFLVFYLAQSCIHHRAVAFLVGFGVLGVPALFAYNANQIFKGAGKMKSVTLAAFQPIPDIRREEMVVQDYSYIEKYVVSWDWYDEAMIFWGIICVIAGVLIAVALKYRWNVKESSNRIINSDRVRSFLVSGVSFAVAMSIAVLTVSLSGNRIVVEEMNRKYMLLVVIFSLGFYGVAQGVLYIYKKRLQKNK